MLMHQGLGLDTFNDLPRRKAVHALYECCGSVAWAARVADGRTYGSHENLFGVADRELRELSDADVDSLASTLPETTRDCAAFDADTRSAVNTACRAYRERFGYRYVACRSTAAVVDPRTILMDLGHRLDNDADTERKVMREELTKINRTRIERLLGPEGGWPAY